jgi:predicted amidohydrolase
MRVGYIQNSPVFGEKERNFDEIRSLIKGIRADLLVLPELFATGYAFTSNREVKELAETSHGITSAFLKEISEMTGAAVIAGFAETDKKVIYNSSMIVCNREVIGTYRKIHLFYKENLWFSPGNKPLKVYTINGVRIGVMICFDWIFPEVCRTLTLKGAQVVAHPSNLVLPYCQDAMVTRCIENRIFAITANRIGTETRGDDDFTFTGASQITSPEGKILDSAPENANHLSVVEIEETDSDNKMVNRYNNLINDRRPRFYNIIKNSKP